MRGTTKIVGLVAVAVALGCRDQAAPTEPPIQFVKGGQTGTGLVGDVVLGDFVTGPNESVIVSTCPATVSSAGWHLSFGHTGCLIVTPSWNDASGFEPYSLTDDLTLVMRKEKGKNGRITAVRLVGQDVIGEAGIFHETDYVPVAIPIVPTKSGYTLHVHAANVAVWRTDAHTGGNRVAMIGWIRIGDIVARPQ